MRVPPAGLFSERPRPRIPGQTRQSFFDRRVRFGRTSRSERRASSLEPEQTVAGKSLLQLADHTQGFVVARLAVVHEDQSEERVRLHVARVARGVFDHAKCALAAAVEADEMRQQTQRRRQT